MNYWLLTSEYPPFFGGGISTYCTITAKMFSDNGHIVTVFVNDDTVKDMIIEQKENIRIIRFSTSRTKSSFFLGYVTNISYEFAHIVKLFIEKEGKPDIIEAQEYQGIAYYLLQYKYLQYDWCRDIPIVVTMHSPTFLYMEYNHIPLYSYPNYWICEMERFCLQAADLLISPSQFMLSELKKRFELKNQNVAVIPNPFSLSHYFTKNKPSADYGKEIVFYGKLSVQKGAIYLLKYFKELWDNGFARPLYLIGGQDIIYHPEGISMGDFIRKEYQKYISRGLLRLEKKIKPVHIADRLSTAEVVIVPSANDNLPYVVFEMMALGKVVLVSKQGGQSEIVDEAIDGFIFDHEQPETFFLQLKKILSLSQEERNNISARAIQKVADKYRPEIIYAKKIQGIKNVLLKKKLLRSLFPFVRSYELPKIIPENEEQVKEKLSIVVPYFNMGKYIDETIQSLLQTDYRNIEILIVNDGSTDKDSIARLSQYRDHPGIKVIDTANKGLAQARNLGAIQSKGEFLAFLDADDTVQKSYYPAAIKILKQYENVHFVGCWTKYFGYSKKVWPTFIPEPPLILVQNLVNSSALIYKRGSFLEAGKNDDSMTFPGFEDYESVISLVEKGYSGVVIPEILFNYRVRPDSMLRKISKEKKLFLYQYISNKHKKFYGMFAADTFNLLNANGPGILADNPSLDHHLADKIPFGRKTSVKLIRLIKRNRYARSIAYKMYGYFKK